MNVNAFYRILQNKKVKVSLHCDVISVLHGIIAGRIPLEAVVFTYLEWNLLHSFYSCRAKHLNTLSRYIETVSDCSMAAGEWIMAEAL